MVDRIILYVSSFLALMLVLSVHEFAHAFVAVKLGDYTPKINGRYSLNPLAHFDILGLICFVFIGFGWAKPVPVNPNNFKNPRRDMLFVSAAGVVANYILAFLFYPLFALSMYVPQFGYFTEVLQDTLYFVVRFSIVFFIFNLLPIYPLDGFRIVDTFVKKRGKGYYFLRNYGIYFLYALIILNVVARTTGIEYFNVLGIAINFLFNYVSYPITAFWGLIL